MKENILNLFFTLTIALMSTPSLKEVVYQDGESKLSGFIAKPSKPLKNKPGVVIIHAWMGITDHEKDTAEKLAELGYYAFDADIYGQGNKPANTKEAGQKAGYYKKNIADYQRRIQLAIDELVRQGANADKIVVIGYCFGGTGAIEAARSNMKVQGVVSFHGGLGRDETREIKPITAKVLVLHGADDKYVPQEEIEKFQNEMRSANADWQMNYYADAVHAFTEKGAGNDKSKGVAYNEKADKRSWQAMLDFLKEM